LDYDTGVGTPEVLKAAPATALDTALGETLYFDHDSYTNVYRWSPARGMRGTINGAKVHPHDFVDFKLAINHAKNGASMMVLGLEIEYEVRVRGNIPERYSD
jgi:hypothetical protein